MEYDETIDAIRQMDRDELFEYLYRNDGTGVLSMKYAWPTDEQVREEALRQCREKCGIREIE